MPLVLSPLYPILDAGYLPGCGVWDEHGQRTPDEGQEREHVLAAIVDALARAGVTMLQYRNKGGEDREVERDALWLRSHAPRSMRILINDRVHLVRSTGCDGVHVGQGDMSPENARRLLGGERILGLSTHSEAQLRAGETSAADYLAVGPIFSTRSKADAEAVVGLEGLRRARALTSKPLVAIGGITPARAAEVRAAGADAIAVISAVFGERGASVSPGMIKKLAGDFLEVFR